MHIRLVAKYKKNRQQLFVNVSHNIDDHKNVRKPIYLHLR